MIAFDRWSAMIFALPIVTAFGVVSTAWVESSSEKFWLPLLLLDEESKPLEFMLVRRWFCWACCWGAAGLLVSAPAWLVPGSVNVCTMTGSTSAALIYRNARVTGFPNSTFASNSEMSFLMNGMFTGRVMT